jgi:hypothetical protein
MTWTKEERAVYMKKYREKNKEKNAVYMKKYRDQENKEKKSEYMKKYRDQENKEEKSEYMKTFREIPENKKTATTTNWKNNGLIHDNYDELYVLYLNCKHCQVCKKEFKNSRDKHMDHDHQTGLFRAFLCRSCNLKDVLKNK